ncbi:FtsW/RodA/SpoVE family cell cycle protein [Bacillaceae bacterium SIJ1]|uniref:FtsW/RodA/SpoVE family cell cycle protein n=1 Tax=Litoribacterium kuwaitense TaxID=1398745 RepID=UPI0013EDBFD0|nr:FtsW/RodA/SpoVE family cell cycle protein [Litoribacterium kuwaitense]NGP44380.1 FtsW/RodA/SpoVE family cell cycle protein [Litoribacterium kuwaitense]
MLKKMLKNYDYVLISLPILLGLFGALMVFSASMVVAVSNEFAVEPAYFFKKQLMWLAIGVVVFIVTALLPYRIYLSMYKWLVLACVGALLAVLIIGTVSGGAQSWISIGGFTIQPAEFAKLAIILYLAGVFSKKQRYISQFSTAVVPPLVFIILIFGLIYLQPDLGTGMIVIMISATVIFCAGLRWKHLLGLIGLGSVAVTLMLIFLTTSNQANRFAAAYQPFDSPGDSGFQLIQSYLAMGTGGLTGVGLGQSIQKGFLPEPHTDFILAIIAEELGIFGVGFVIISLAVIVIKGLQAAIRCEDTFGSLLAVGISGMIGIQTFVNIGAMSGLLPVTGVTLPFISYGGSSLVLLMASAGILCNISMFVRYRRLKENEADPLADHSASNKVSISSAHRFS